MITDFSGNHAFLSNFYPCQIVVYGMQFASTEHAFQAYKMVTLQNAIRVRECTSPGAAKRLSRSLPCRPDWQDIKDHVMYTVCSVKFEDPVLQKMLLDTGDEELIEGNNWNDCYWGVCRGLGLNKLGQTLMQIRAELRA